MECRWWMERSVKCRILSRYRWYHNPYLCRHSLPHSTNLLLRSTSAHPPSSDHRGQGIRLHPSLWRHGSDSVSAAVWCRHDDITPVIQHDWLDGQTTGLRGGVTKQRTCSLSTSHWT